MWTDPFRSHRRVTEIPPQVLGCSRVYWDVPDRGRRRDRNSEEDRVIEVRVTGIDTRSLRDFGKSGVGNEE